MTFSSFRFCAVSAALALALLAACASGTGGGGLVDAGTQPPSDSGAEPDANEENDGGTIKDASKADAKSDPCANANGGDGTYCSVNLKNMGDPSTLYRCKAGATSSTKSCADGCSADDSGGADFCDPCGSQTDGYYCLKALDPSTTSSGVVRCGGNDLLTFQKCTNGCASATPGAAKCN